MYVSIPVSLTVTMTRIIETEGWGGRGALWGVSGGFLVRSKMGMGSIGEEKKLTRSG